MASLLDALIQTESSGIAGRRGQRTRYGTPLGLTQLLPATAREMAQKLGMEWRPDLLTSPAPDGAQYQRALGQAYLDEGLQRTGNTRDALRYYHGGPNRSQWGPKTNAYADKVLALSGGEPMPSITDYLDPRRAAQFSVDFGDPQQAPGIAALMQAPPVQPDATPVPDVARMSPVAPGERDPLAPKPKAFGQGGTGWKVLGILGDALQTMGGGKATYAEAMQDERTNQRTMELYRQKVAQEREERLHSPYRFQNNRGDVVQLDPATGKTSVLYADPTPKTEWAKIEDPTTGAIEMRPVPSASQPTPAHVQALREHPDQAAAFDAKFGRGMAAYFLGAQ
jgi:hypothetical protein